MQLPFLCFQRGPDIWSARGSINFLRSASFSRGRFDRRTAAFFVMTIRLW
jgi:hypothetical protein